MHGLLGRRRALETINEKLDSILGALPGAYCIWDMKGNIQTGGSLCQLLDIELLQDFSDIQNRLTPDDSTLLNEHFLSLRQEGKSFSATVRNHNKTNIFRIEGYRASHYDVLWFEDRTIDETARSKLEDDLIQKNFRLQQLQAALEALPHPAWIRDADQKIIWCNKSYADALGSTSKDVVIDQKELAASTMQKKRDGESSRQIRREQARHAIESKRSQIIQSHIIVQGKRLLARIAEIPLQDGQTTLGLVEDITQQEDLESELKRYQDANRDLLEQLRTAIAIYSADHRLEFYNSAFSQLWGLEEQWLNSRPKLGDIMEKLRENRRLPEQADFRRFKQSWIDMFTGLIEPQDDMLHLPDGSALRMLVVPHAMGGLMMTFEDVTSRLELESSYNTLIAVQKETLDNLAEGVAVYGGDGRLKLWNPAFAELWKLNPEDLEGEPHINKIAEKINPFFSTENWPEVREKLINASLSRMAHEMRLTREDNSLIDYITVPLPDGGVLATYSDITDSVRVENVLREKNAALEAAEQLKTDFLANVSYQLRTPLNAIMGFTEILDQEYFGPLNKRQKEYTHDMKEAGERLLGLINDILDLSTIEAGYLNLQTQQVKVYKMLDNLVDLVDEWARKEKIEVTLSCPKNIGSLEADERRLKQAIINLIRNAIAYTPEGGDIDITAKRRKNGIAITVSDNGSGISPEDQERIFEPFERGSAGRDSKSVTGSTARMGAGLGLTLVKNIITLHGGTLELETTLGKGSSFTMLLPFKQESLKDNEGKE